MASRMRLFTTPTSPFVRKVRIAVRELGLLGSVEEIPSGVLPTHHANAAIEAGNPLGKIPTLLPTPESGPDDALFGSQVIAQYLNDLGVEGRRILPASGTPQRTRVLANEALADGVLDAVVLVRYETWLRPEALQWKEWIDGQMGKVQRGLDAIEVRVSSGALLAPPPADAADRTLDLGSIAVVCLLGCAVRVPH
ncbi:Glutathione S-transferase protein [Cladochytrium tenue]|nr:Glutathione S-transferase protein [Cladochytrium tenue]